MRSELLWFITSNLVNLSIFSGSFFENSLSDLLLLSVFADHCLGSKIKSLEEDILL